MFKLWHFLGHCGFFVHEGLRGMEPAWWPQARVLYPPEPKLNIMEESRSRPMAIGNACNYASLFGGRVVPVDFQVDESA